MVVGGHRPEVEWGGGFGFVPGEDGLTWQVGWVCRRSWQGEPPPPSSQLSYLEKGWGLFGAFSLSCSLVLG